MILSILLVDIMDLYEGMNFIESNVYPEGLIASLEILAGEAMGSAERENELSANPIKLANIFFQNLGW